MKRHNDDHTHPCTSCGTPTDCGGPLEADYDGSTSGWSSHCRAHVDAVQFLCADCAERWDVAARADLMENCEYIDALALVRAQLAADPAASFAVAVTRAQALASTTACAARRAAVDPDASAAILADLGFVLEALADLTPADLGGAS